MLNAEYVTQNAERRTRNAEHGTRNAERGTRNAEHGTRTSSFHLPTANPYPTVISLIQITDNNTF